ncbi:NADH-quinone oxidoreductase subunit D [Hydrogenobaculum sp.]|nr:MAG: NADH-quinone oxidoreductase subunit NuoD [Hydrogenobaculum sp.]PMP92514.1 MAG: NADH-quinone oxidoreductase subunit NuoD [Hydrogenobaculum sp.]
MQASERTLNEIKAKLPYVEVKKDKLLSVVYVQKELLINTLKAIKEDFGFKLFIDHSVVDTLEAQNRFEAFYILYNVDTKERIVVKTRTEHSLPSAEKLWFAAKWAERECYDMFGINYEGHEHLVRAFMWDTYSHHPLRKDFPLQGYETVELPSLNETVFGDTLSGTMNYRRTHTYVPTLKDLEYTERNRIKKKAQVVLNWGPLHPGTHGTMWFLFDLEGERIVQTDVILGQLHRGVEKLAEHEPYQQFLVYTDRMDYISALCSNQAWTVAVERLLGIEDIVPLKAKYIRTMMSELQRINSHLLWLGTYALDLGALTIFLYAFKEREKIMDIIEGITGARLTISYTRIGGVRMDLPEGALEVIESFIKFFPKELKDWEKILSRNRIWVKRNKDVGVLSKEDIYFYGLTGAVARGSGVFYDIRKLEPYDAYSMVEFDVPLGENGDCYDRYLVRIEEMKQSIRIIEQCVQKLKTMSPNEPFMAESQDPKKLKLTLDGIGLKVPAGEIYSSGENPRGELGFYINSKGGLKPYRVKIRPGSFYNLCVYPHLMENRYVADAVTILASLDPVVGEVDR